MSNQNIKPTNFYSNYAYDSHHTVSNPGSSLNYIGTGNREVNNSNISSSYIKKFGDSESSLKYNTYTKRNVLGKRYFLLYFQNFKNNI